jgi:hypothetical protein
VRHVQKVIDRNNLALGYAMDIDIGAHTVFNTSGNQFVLDLLDVVFAFHSAYLAIDSL